jgi:hypothetical protein
MLVPKKATYQLISNEGKNATKCTDDAGNSVRDLDRFKKETNERVRCGVDGMEQDRGECVCDSKIISYLIE